MALLYLLEKIRMPVLNEFMLIITRLGEETAFLVIALILFWCVDKRRGYYILSVGFLGTMANQFLKLLCRIPRPWVLDGNFTILEGAREAATGYSFPSGHSQTAVGTCGGIACTAKNRWVRGICIAIAVLVPVSRMYVGVHTPYDVLVGAGMALILVFALKPVVMDKDEKAMGILVAVMLAASIALLLYVHLFPFPADVDEQNLRSGLKNAYTMLGCTAGIAVVYPCERRFMNFETKAVWWVQILKTVGGLIVVLLVKEGLRGPLELLFAGNMIARAVRYFLVVLTAGLVWPSTFRWFAQLGGKQ